MPKSCDACEEDIDNDGICEDHCEDMLITVVVDCECSFFNPNTYTVFSPQSMKKTVNYGRIVIVNVIMILMEMVCVMKMKKMYL